MSTIPVCSGIGIRPAPPGPPIQLGQIKGASVRFTDFTMGWAELHGFMRVNEQRTAMPSMTFDAGVSAWTGGQYVGACIPTIQTADLATAWERETQTNVSGNYVF